MTKGLLHGLLGLAIVGAAFRCPSGLHATDTSAKSSSAVPISPEKVERILTPGPSPALNSYLFVLGAGGKIVNGLPYFAHSARWKYQWLIAPQIRSAPIIQGMMNSPPDWEQILALHADLAVVFSESLAKSFAERNVPAVVLTHEPPLDSIRSNVLLLGQILGKSREATAYASYFEAIVALVTQRLAAIPKTERPRVLYCQYDAKMVPHRICDALIAQAGGQNVAPLPRSHDSFPFSIETILGWNPNVIIVSRPEEVEEVTGDSRLSQLPAVRNRRVFPCPMGVLRWLHGTTEAPLSLLWLASLFYPECFRDIDIQEETVRFYRRFYRYPLTREEAVRILAGNP